MTKRHHPVGSDTLDLVEEDLVNQDASKVTKLSFEGLIASKDSDVVLTPPFSYQIVGRSLGIYNLVEESLRYYVICKDCKVVYN